MDTKIYCSFYRKYVWIFCFINCALIAQTNEKKMLTRAEYKLWSTLTPESISDDGQWHSYSLRYDSGADTLFVKHTDYDKTFPFPKGQKGVFNSDLYFACIDEQKRLTIFDLKRKKKEVIENVLTFQWIGKEGKLLVNQFNGKEGGSSLLIYEKGTVVKTINNITTFSVSPSSEVIAYAVSDKTSGACGIIELKKNLACKIVFSSDGVVTDHIVWEQEDKGFVFLERKIENQTSISKVHLYDLKNKRLSTFDAKSLADVAEVNCISSNTELISIAPDLENIFFGIQQDRERALIIDPLDVQIWNSEDKYDYPLKAEIDGWNVVDKIVVWHPKKGNFKQITNNIFPRLTLNSLGTYAIVHNPDAYEPQHHFYSNVDYYLMDVNSGAQELLLRDFPAGDYSAVFSPDGKNISYFKERNWWVYNIAAKTHINTTSQIGEILDDENNDMPDIAHPYSKPMWSADGKYFLFYDQYDIWKVTLEGEEFSKLTDGRAQNKRFRFHPQNLKQRPYLKYDSGQSAVFDLKARLYLSVRDKTTGSSGYYLWKSNNSTEKIVFGRKEVSNLRVTANGVYFYMEQKYDCAPSIWMKRKGTAVKKVFQSNPQHDMYYWGKSELISYTNKAGKILRGLLFYPANYSSINNYPLVVDVYMNQGIELNKYVNPSEYNRNGFNSSNFTTRGYFVFLPDMFYEIGDHGVSATDCVLSGVRAVQEKVSIDSMKIGICGHSHGGYEVNFIITQTHIFTAALSGSGISDLTSNYLQFGWNYKRPEIWRYEYMFMRMGKSLFEDKEGYDRNSPVVHVSNIKTPLLLWTGSNDTQVDPQQSMEFYLALRRLKKKNIFLIYPNEGHTLHDRKNQYDLTLKYDEWFDYYLNEGTVPKWTVPNIINY